MPRVAWLAVLTLIACEADEGPGPMAALAGHWEAEAVRPPVTDVLELDDQGHGVTQLHRYTFGLIRYDADVVVVPTDDETIFEMSLRCNGRAFDCERQDFDATCMLEASDELLCDAPDWYHDPNWIEFGAVD